MVNVTYNISWLQNFNENQVMTKLSYTFKEDFSRIGAITYYFMLILLIRSIVVRCCGVRINLIFCEGDKTIHDNCSIQGYQTSLCQLKQK